MTTLLRRSHRGASRHRHHLGRHTVTLRTTFDPDRCHSVTGAYRFPWWPQPFRSEVANNSNRVATNGAEPTLGSCRSRPLLSKDLTLGSSHYKRENSPQFGYPVEFRPTGMRPSAQSIATTPHTTVKHPSASIILFLNCLALPALGRSFLGAYPGSNELAMNS